MTMRITCPQGHEWELAQDSDSAHELHPICPECGTLCDFEFYAETDIATDDEADAVPPAPSCVDAAPLTDAEQAVLSVPGYEILDHIGQGGMGVVYKARHERLNRLVALKMISVAAHLASGPRRRFRVEAEAIARLQHPNVVQIYEVGEVPGCPWIALEFVDGGSLADRLNGIPMSARDAAQSVSVIADAIDYAHQQGILHRDLKPDNILLTQSGMPKVADFGLAKRLDRGPAETHAGTVLGTPSYMAPEQALADVSATGPQTDIYALGAILYEMLTGRPPHRGANSVETLRHVVESDPAPPRLLKPSIPRDLETICLQALARSPARRYRTAGAMADDLRRMLEDRPIRARHVSRLERGWKWCVRNPRTSFLTVVLFSVLMIAVIGASVYQTKLSGARQLSEARQIALNAQEFNRLIGRARHRELNKQPGWRWAALNDLRDAANSLIDDASRHSVRNDAARFLLAYDLRPVARIPVDTRPSRIAFHPTRPSLAVGAYSANAAVPIRILDVPTRELELQVHWESAIRDGVRALSYSSDGNTLVAGTRTGRVFCWQQRTGTVTASWDTGSDDVVDIVISPDGSFLYSATTDSKVTRWCLDVPGEVDAQVDIDRTIYSLSLSRDGSILACGVEDGVRLFHADTLLAFDQNAFEEFDTTALRDWMKNTTLAFAPDGRRLAVGWTSQIQVLDVEDQKRITAMQDSVFSQTSRDRIDDLVFDPTGTLIASTDTRLKLWDVAGERTILHVPIGGDSECHPDFSPAGRIVAVTSDDEVLLFEIGGLQLSSSVAFHSGPVKSFEISADGQFLACISGETLQYGFPESRDLTIWRLSDGLRLRKLRLSDDRVPVQQPVDLTLAPGSNALACLSSGWQMHVMREFPLGTLNSFPSSNWSRALAFSADGSRLFEAVIRLQDWIRMPEFVQGLASDTTMPGSVVAWEVSDLTSQRMWSNFAGRVRRGESRSGLIHLCAGNRWLVAGSRDYRAYVFAVDDVTKAFEIACDGPVTATAVNSRDSLIALGTDQGALRFVDPDSQRITELPDAHGDGVSVVRFAPDDELFASASYDGSLKLWQVRDEPMSVLTLRFPGRVVIDLQFGPREPELYVLLQGETAIRRLRIDRLRSELRSMRLDW